MTRRLLFVVNVDWFFVSHRLPIALAAKQQGFEVHIAASLSDQRALLESHGLIVHPLELDRSSTGLFAQLRLLQQLSALIRKVRPDLVHLITIKPVLLGGLVARLYGVPGVVAAISGLGFIFIDQGMQARLRRAAVGWLYRLALGHPNLRAIFQNPDDCATVMRLAHLPAHKSVLIPGSGVNLEVYAHAPLHTDPPVVMLAARLLIDKGVREFVAAARQVREQLATTIPVRFVLVGTTDPGNPASILPQEVTHWVDDGDVEWWGHRTDMPLTLSEATIVVLPSYREGLPKVLIEAAAVGRPVVTTDVPGCRDAIDPGATGLLVPPQDPVALADAIVNLLTHPDKMIAMGSAGRKLAEGAFDQQQVIAQHLDIYQALQVRA